MTEREAFEAWSKTYDFSQGMGGALWAAWQARASKPEPAQEPVAFAPDNYKFQSDAYGRFTVYPLKAHLLSQGMEGVPLYAAPLSDKAKQDRIMELEKLLRRARWFVQQENDACIVACAENPDYCCADTLLAIDTALDAEVRK
jgi:hypothetical protein